MAADTATAAPPASEQAPTEQATSAPVAASPEPRTAEMPAAPAAAKGENAKKPKKGEKGGKGAKGAKGQKAAKGAASDADGPSVAAHPRAARAVASAKGWGGLLGFVLGGYLSLPTNTVAAAGLRALVAGVVCYVAAWAGAVFLWRRLVMLEIKGREQELLAAAQAARRRELPPAPAERTSARAAS